MAELHDVMAYIMRQYPPHMASDLSNARLTKMVYLSDWRHALEEREQITEIEWYFDNFGPFVHDIEQTAAARDDLFIIDSGSNAYGQSKRTFSLRNVRYAPVLEEAERRSIDHVISVTQKMFWAAFIKLVYSTHPIASSQRYTYLDLVAKAAEYRHVEREVSAQLSTA